MTVTKAGALAMLVGAVFGLALPTAKDEIPICRSEGLAAADDERGCYWLDGGPNGQGKPFWLSPDGEVIYLHQI